MNESYLKEVHEKLYINIQNILKPIREYISELDSKYNGLYSEELVYEINMFIDENHTFEEVVEKREHFQVYNNFTSL